MPSQRVTLDTEKNSNYQICVKGTNNQLIYIDDQDYRYFLSLLEANLLTNDSLEVMAYCLAPDHFCLLANQTADNSVKQLLQKVINSYNYFFYEKHLINDLLSESNCAITKVTSDDLLDISRNIHKSSTNWLDCEYSSIRAYFYDDVPAWLNKDRIAKLYGSTANYLSLMNQ